MMQNMDVEDQPAQAEPTKMNTLDEPVLSTLWRDISRVGYKLFHVLIPRGYSEKALRDWDLWGPLVFCLALALVLGGDLAVQVFIIVALGSIVITLNSILLGGKVSFFQSVCLVGYCIFPILLAAIICTFVNIPLGSKSWAIFFNIGFAAGGFVWSVWASVGFLSAAVPDHRRLLAIYPVILFYAALSWLVLISYKQTGGRGTIGGSSSSGNSTTPTNGTLSNGL
ncbi:Yip1 domain-containing protein [Planoprotostelium fungivorum]|uniref:Protein YIPF n=1 Tax=Planoprotostelium fungivorum TaxID=1890364 RepID=A0A2P6N8X1_9EUKA|nr:Yip1 domain-containing protein [Planoprotostelium fungivorum]